MPVVGPARVVGWSGSEFVLVNQPTEHVASVDRWRRSLAVGCCGIRRIEVESAMRSSAVVMIDVLGEDRLDVASTEDQEVVQAVFSDGANPAFGKRVRPWGAARRLDGLDADRGEYSVERRGELGVPVADEEAETTTGIFESAGEVAGDLGHPEIAGVGGDAEEVNHAAFDFDHEQDT